jgi:glycosyltransferase involved in cell wall biosynthesis
MAEADAVIVHCEAGRRELLSRYPRRGPMHVIPMGNYSGVFPITVDRASARANLGIDESSFVYLALGNVASYKGLDRLVKAFSAVADDHDIALIAGRNRDNALVGRLELAARQDGRIRVHAGFVPDEAMQHFLLAADVMVVPFQRILTSSSVMTGLSYGLPVIVPDLGCLPELVTADSGLVYRASVPGSLERALEEIKARDLKAMSDEATAVSGRYDWNDVGRLTAGVYGACLEV